MPMEVAKTVGLKVALPVAKHQDVDRLSSGLRQFYGRGDLTDVALVCADQTFPAHRVVLAAQSEVFREGLQAPATPEARQEVRLADIANPEAVKFMLDYMYQMDVVGGDDYDPKTEDVNKDVLRLAQNFKLAGLTDRCTQWLAKGLHTGNVVERLTICEDFGLSDLRERVMEQLTLDKRALAEVASNPQIMTHPRLMQAMLQLAAGVPDDAVAQPKKKARK